MKKCYICKKELSDNEEEICNECSEFFKWKYSKDFKKRLDLHKENLSKLRKQNKFRRAK